MRRLPLVVSVLAACLPDPGADLAGPRVIASTLASYAVEVPIVPTIELELSEPLDPSTLSAAHVVLIRWEEVGRCDLTPVCEKGQCGAGRCWEDPLSATDLSALDRGEYQADPEADVVVELEADVAATRIVLEPARTLEPRARYSLVLGQGVRDPSGAGLVDGGGHAARWRSDFVTGDEASAGPVPRLSFPAPGAADVPTNLVRIETYFLAPIDLDEKARLRLSDSSGGARVEAAWPVPCEGWVPGFCAAWAVDGMLPADAELSIVGGTVVDGWGRDMVVPWIEESFRTAPGPDLVAPSVEDVALTVRGPCVVADWNADASAQVTLRVGKATAELGVDPGRVTVAVRASEGPGEVDARFEAIDLAGNAAQVERALALDSPPPLLAITEVLANPAGPEPHQEFVELFVFGAEPVELDGLWLSDLSWAQVSSELASGSKPPGDPLPAVTLAPGVIALVVADGYDAAEGSDASPPDATRLLRVDASLGQGGLKNAGEPLTVYRPDPLALVASYGNFVDTSASAHGGRSVAIGRPSACDVASSWSSHPLGRSTPGRLP